MTTRAWKSWAPSSIRYLVMMAAITLLACGRDTPSTAPPGAPVRLVISPAGLILDFGAQGLVRAHGIDANGRVTATVVEWSSDDSFIATVGRNDGVVIAVGAGTATVTAIAGTLQATTTVVVHPPKPPASVSVSPSVVTIVAGGVEQLTARARDIEGRPTSVSFEWSSADPAIVTVGPTDGMITGISIGTTTVTASVGDLRATAIVSVETGAFVEQWAASATASTEYTTEEWSAAQATGAPNVDGCEDDPRAWATLAPDGVDWLELTYVQPVRPSEIRIHENWAVGSIVKVELKDASGSYQTVHTAQPSGAFTCPRVLTIPITGITTLISTIRISLDQRLTLEWNEIDAVRLAGYR